MWKYILFGVASVLVVGGAFAYALSRQAVQQSRQAEATFADIEASAGVSPGNFEVAMLDRLPEVARRYFLHAIAPGTPLKTTVRLRMQGNFLLGDKDSFQTYSMTARQVLAPPDAFIWIPSMVSSAIHISGSDALSGGNAWTRFWIGDLIPVVNSLGGGDLARSALARAAMESVWVPASLLPQMGVRWEQTGANTARLYFATGIEPIDLVLDADGVVLQVTTMRWSDANPQKTFRLQSFGGTMEAEGTFEGFTIPTRIEVGNHFGTAQYLPFFQANLVAAEYLPEGE
jgi:hypothetical protein